MRPVFVNLSVFFLIGAWLSQPAWAAPGNRKAHFNGFARVETPSNPTVPGLDTPINAECSLTITNPSANAQVVDIVGSGTIGAYVNGSTTLTAATASTASTLSGCTIGLNMTGCVLAANGGSVTISYAYPTIPRDTVQNQMVHCSGLVQVRDQADNAPGFVVATGSLMTFLPTSTQKLAVYRCNPGCGYSYQDLRANVSFSQIQILIGEGRPF